MARPLNVLAALDKVAPPVPPTKPADAFDCALKAHGCTGWVKAQYAIFELNGTLYGLCPRKEAHQAIVAANTEAATIRARFSSLFNLANPSYVKGQPTQRYVAPTATA